MGNKDKNYLIRSQNRKKRLLKSIDRYKRYFSGDFHFETSHWGNDFMGVFIAKFTGSASYTFYGIEICGISLTLIV